MKIDDSSHEIEKKPIAIILIDSFIVILIIFTLMYTYFINSQFLLKILVSIILVASVVWLFFVKVKEKPTEKNKDDPKINKLVLLGNDGESLKEWYIQGIPSMLIGKSSPDHEVDIDLADVEYASLISKEHAVLNYSSGSWFIEDIDSENGVGIRKLGEKTAHKLQNDQPNEIHFGDMIYLANTQILVK